MNAFPLFRTKHRTRSEIPDKRQKSQSPYLIYASRFIEFRGVVEKAKEIFAREQIWPDQCDYVIYRMQPLQNTVACIARRESSGRKRESHPPAQNHYPLLISAHYVSEQVEGLITSIREYRDLPDSRTGGRSKHRTILNLLDSLDSSLHELVQELDKTSQN